MMPAHQSGKYLASCDLDLINIFMLINSFMQENIIDFSLGVYFGGSMYTHTLYTHTYIVHMFVLYTYRTCICILHRYIYVVYMYTHISLGVSFSLFIFSSFKIVPSKNELRYRIFKLIFLFAYSFALKQLVFSVA